MAITGYRKYNLQLNKSCICDQKYQHAKILINFCTDIVCVKTTILQLHYKNRTWEMGSNAQTLGKQLNTWHVLKSQQYSLKDWQICTQIFHSKLSLAIFPLGINFLSRQIFTFHEAQYYFTSSYNCTSKITGCLKQFIFLNFQ